jgi:hypothetical protein
MTKRNLIITIILLSFIDLVAAGWYMSRRIEASGNSQNFFAQRDSTEVVIEADTVVTTFQDDLFDELQHNTYYFIANTPSISGDNSSRYTSIKHVKVRWPRKVNGDSEFEQLNKELISKAFGNAQSRMKDARYLYLNKPTFNKPIGDDYKTLSSAPTIVPVYGNVSQVLVYPYMTSQRLLVMEVDKVEYNGRSTNETDYFIHYDRQRQRVLSRIDILIADVDKENKLLKVINKKIDEMNKGRGDSNQLQHALNVPAEVCCSKKGVLFQYKQGSISNDAIAVMVNYDDVEPFMTEDFKELLRNNDDYKLFDEKLKPEPINPTQKTSKPDETSVKKDNNTYKSKKSYKQKSDYRQKDAYKQNSEYKQKDKSYGKKYYKKKRYSKPTRTKRRHYNGAKRKSGRYGYAGRRHWSRRQR